MGIRGNRGESVESGESGGIWRIHWNPVESCQIELLLNLLHQFVLLFGHLPSVTIIYLPLHGVHVLVGHGGGGCTFSHLFKNEGTQFIIFQALL